MARMDENRPAEAGGEIKRITALDIQKKEFRVSFRGYNEREVDEFLDAVTEELARLHSENTRLAEQVELQPGAPLGAEAEGVLRRAKEEAERIVAEARSRAGSMRPVPSGPGEPSPAGVDATGAVNRFLAREREFLQVLAEKIHLHIEAVKEDARELRQSPQAGAPARPPAAPRLDETAAFRPDRSGSGSGPGSLGGDQEPRASGSVGIAAPDAGGPAGRGSAPDLDMPEASVPGGSGGLDAGPAGSVSAASPEGPDDDGSSLRELFWGEQ